MNKLLRDRYEPLEVVGHGGEGRVLRAVDRQHDRVVALKVRRVRNDDARGQLLHEARLLLGIVPHPNLTLVREDFFDGDQYVIVMDWIDGTDLSRILRSRGHPGLAPSSVLGWIADAASALTHLHTQTPPVVHGDVKPANLVLTTGGRVVLVDFGLSSVPNSHHRLAGTSGYAAPEIAAGGSPTRASDVYSLAATAHCLLTGGAPTGIRPSWEGIDAEAAVRLEDAIRAGLATDPARRPTSPGALVERLRAGWGSTLPTGVLTFCLTDIEDAAARWDADPEAMSRDLVRHDEVLTDVVERHGGRSLKSTGAGDATISVFEAVTDAVAAAIDLQRRLADQPLRVRAALHTGEAERRGGDYVGPPLHVATQLRDLADGGQVLLSATTAELVAGALPDGATLVDLGPHRLRGLDGPVFAVAAPGVAAPPPATECPYPGLPPFERHDAERFFGRDAVVADLVDRLRTTSFAAVVGASGSGKSSALRAGLAATWGEATVRTPGRHPEPVAEGSSLVVVDQLEEAFTLCDDDAGRHAFFDSLATRTGPVAVGLRADFYGRIAEHPDLARLVAGNQVLLGPMGEDELRQAITGPAAIAGVRIDPALVDLLVTEVVGEPGALPLLSHALRATWQQRDGRTLSVDAYRATGGVRAAIATTAEEVFGSLDHAQQALARRTFLALTEPGDGTDDTRRRATIADLTPASADQDIAELLDAMARARLVTVHDTTVEIAHEALIKSWPRLRDWIDEDRDGLRIHHHLAGAAREWDERGRDTADLYRGHRLLAATELAALGEVLSSTEATFLAASATEQERAQRHAARTNRRLRTLLGVVGVALVAALVTGALAVDRQRDASRSRDEADIARVAAESRSLVDRQPDLGLLLATAAFDLDDSPDTRDALLQALQAHPLLEGLIYGNESGLEAVAFSPNGQLLATPTSDGTGTILWDTATRQQLDVLRHEDDFSLDAAISPDGRWLAVPSIHGEAAGRPDGRLEVWDLRARTLLVAVDSPAGVLTTAAFSEDGSRLFTQGGPAFDTAPRDVVVIWDTATWMPVDTWDIDEDYSGDATLVVNRDGTSAAIPLLDGTIATFRTGDRSPLGPPIVVDPSSGPVLALAFDTEGTVLAIGTDDGKVRVVDPVAGTTVRQLDVADTAPSAIEFSPTDELLAVGRLDGRTQLYDHATGAPVGPSLAASAAAITDVSFSADGTRLATAGLDRTGAIWRLDGDRSIGQAYDGQDAPVTEAAFTPDGTRILTSALDGTVAVRTADGSVQTTIRLPGEALSVSADPTAPRLAAGTTGAVVIAGLDGRILHEIDVQGASAHQVAFAPDGSAVAIAIDNTAGNPDAAGPGTGAVRFVDPDSGDFTGPTIGFDEPAWGATFAPDGQTIAVITRNNLVQFRSVADGRPTGDPIANVDAPILTAAFSPDGTRFAIGTASGTVRQYDAATHEPLGDPLDGDANSIGGVAYSPDGTVLAGTSVGFSTTRLWDALTGRTIGSRLTGGRVPYSYQTFLIDHFITSRPAFAPGGDVLVTPGFEGATVQWNLDPTNWTPAACAIAGRDLSDEEWDRYLPGREHRSLCGGS